MFINAYKNIMIGPTIAEEIMANQPMRGVKIDISGTLSLEILHSFYIPEKIPQPSKMPRLGICYLTPPGGNWGLYTLD